MNAKQRRKCIRKGYSKAAANLVLNKVFRSPLSHEELISSLKDAELNIIKTYFENADIIYEKINDTIAKEIEFRVEKILISCTESKK